jgi:hypothetical protein
LPRYILLGSMLLMVGLLAGCNAPSVLPGFGGGVGSPGTENPDGTLHFQMTGTAAEDFYATSVTREVNQTGLLITAKQTELVVGWRVERTLRLQFPGLPVERAYAVGTGAEAVSMTYSEARPNQPVSEWVATAGEVNVSRVSATHMEGSLRATFGPSTNTTTTLEASRGRLQVRLP